VIGLLIFAAAMLAGCVFLIYFLFALWRDSHRRRIGPQVKDQKTTSINGVPIGMPSVDGTIPVYSASGLPPRAKLKREKAKLLQIYDGDHFPFKGSAGEKICPAKSPSET
jgi:hypothetical protein